VNCPVDVCMKRDVKGLYKKALSGELDNMTGVQAPYEEPFNPEVSLRTDSESVEECAKKIISG